MALERWKIDRHIPVAVILTIVLQTIGVIIWATNLGGRVTTIETELIRMQAQEPRIQLLERTTDRIGERIINIEKATDRIEKKLDKLSLNWKPRTVSLKLEEMTLAQLMDVKVSA